MLQIGDQVSTAYGKGEIIKFSSNKGNSHYDYFVELGPVSMAYYDKEGNDMSTGGTCRYFNKEELTLILLNYEIY